MATEKRERQELERLLDGILESILEAPEEEIDEDLRAAGEDPDAAAERLRGRLAATVERHRFRRRGRAKLRIQQNLLLASARPWEFPEAERRSMELLGAALRRRPELERLLEVRLRELQTLSDDEVKDCLRQLAEVGGLDDVLEAEE